jgi:hypothetical protein
MSTKKFLLSLDDYRYLRENGYPEKAALKLIGDKHRLSRIERNTLFRGVIPEQVAAQRRIKLVSPDELRGGRLGIDWYNVLITVESFLRGSPLFVCDDNVVRDSSATHGSYRRSSVTDRAIEAITDALSLLAPSRFDAFLDSPIAFSGRMAEEIRDRLARLSIPFAVTLERTADYPLKSYDGIVASSDSVILDCAASIFDLPRFAIQIGFRITPPPLADLSASFPKVFGQ